MKIRTNDDHVRVQAQQNTVHEPCQPESPNVSFQKASGTNHSRYTPVVSMMPRARNRDEPARKMNSSSATASRMLICDNHLMHTSRPEATEVTAILVTIAMRITSLSLFSSTAD